MTQIIDIRYKPYLYFGLAVHTIYKQPLDHKQRGMNFTYFPVYYRTAQFCEITKVRHWIIVDDSDLYNKEGRILTNKYSPVHRLPKQVYKIPKKTLQLEVKRVAIQLGHIPTRDELTKYGAYPIEYYDQYFIGWGEITAAARTTGMTEDRVKGDGESAEKQLRLLDRGESSAKLK
jgi:hypothetical protein